MNGLKTLSVKSIKGVHILDISSYEYSWTCMRGMGKLSKEEMGACYRGADSIYFPKEKSKEVYYENIL
ncbi:hypothetical protein ACSS6N_17780 [Peribacillus frigoritolerans]|uniref:hypothetical protein n=1 Tax=Peribacillus frigoritolerans TaxID=450367 RepID=UPI003F852621